MFCDGRLYGRAGRARDCEVLASFSTKRSHGSGFTLILVKTGLRIRITFMRIRALEVPTIFLLSCVFGTSFSLNANPYPVPCDSAHPDPSSQNDADPKPASQNDTDPASQNDTDPDPPKSIGKSVFVLQGRGASLPQGGEAGFGACQRGAGRGPGPSPQQARGQVGTAQYW